MRRVFLSSLLIIAACSGHHGGSGTGDDDAGTGSDGGVNISGLDVEPSALQTITVPLGASSPTVGYSATFNGAPALVNWTVDRGDLGRVGASGATTMFQPSGTTGGLVNVRATLGTASVSRQIFIELDGGTQNGANDGSAEAQQIASTADQLGSGGGIGGVGGEGLGSAVSDPATLTALGSPVDNGSAEGLKLLYPYDATVWPRGMLAPLLMWSWSDGDADAIQIELSTTSGSFHWVGTFGRPAILTTTGGPYIRAPIPQDIWQAATDSAGGSTPTNVLDQLTMKLTVAHNGTAHGPITQTWTIAPALLTGTVYYNSYGTLQVNNFNNATDSAGHYYGGAILGIRSGDIAPHLVVGQDSPNTDTGCRVCHVVAAKGRWLMTQSEPGYAQSHIYDLQAADPQASPLDITSDGVFAWAGMTSDGSYAYTNSIEPSSTNDAITQTAAGFYQFGPMATPVAVSGNGGLTAGMIAGYPSFSPDDKFMSYVDGTGLTIEGGMDTTNLPIAEVSYDSTLQTFGTPATIYTPPVGTRAGYPAYLPDDNSVIFEQQVRSSTSDTVMVTRNSARSELEWINVGSGTPTATVLGNLDGVGYLPGGPNNHGTDNTDGYDDTTLDYEPTVLPIVVGGYAWVVFTSRRLYGNQCVTDPWSSGNIGGYDILDSTECPTKKLWVAAIDLNGSAGGDPSHPGFYLPAQELGAGNSRGFWVLDPCRADGSACTSGDQCCDGYCEPDGSGDLVCAGSAACSNLQDACTTSADCCDPTNECINGFCAAQVIQ